MLKLSSEQAETIAFPAPEESSRLRGTEYTAGSATGTEQKVFSTSQDTVPIRIINRIQSQLESITTSADARQTVLIPSLSHTCA